MLPDADGPRISQGWSVSFHVRASKGSEVTTVGHPRPASERQDAGFAFPFPEAAHAATPLPSVFGLARVERLGHRRAQVETAPAPHAASASAPRASRAIPMKRSMSLPERDRILDTEGAQLGISSAREP